MKQYIVGADSIVDASCVIHPGVVIGEHCRLEKNVTVGANCVIADHVTIGRNAVISPCVYLENNVPPYAVVRSGNAHIANYVDAVQIPFRQTAGGNADTPGKTGGKIYRIPSFADMRGDLCVVEWGKLLPFDIKRIFYTYHVPSSEVRGEHAHKVCDQFLIAIAGTLHVITDNGCDREEFVLDSPTFGLHIPAGVWGIQYKHSADSVLLVLASHPYDKNDYIRDYNEYLEYIKP